MQQITSDILNVIRKRPTDSFKGTFGKICLIGGNKNFGGAIIMATMAAVYSGAGLVSTITDKANLSSLHSQLPEAMFVDNRDRQEIAKIVTGVDVVVIGPGLGEDDNSLTLLKSVFKLATKNQIFVIDGSAITLIAKKGLDLPDSKLNVLTPHQMEWQRLSGIKIIDQTTENSQRVANELGATVVLKSSHTHVYADDEVFENTTGSPAQATGGMGDTLAGLIGGFLCQFEDKQQAILAAVYTHSAIADEIAKTHYVVLPHQISQELPKFMKQHEN
ncbi:NAD(P)H-hydrate dehydratase [Lentilactobacillus sp. Marseille-Q4993]|uniref:NAD(P)H-hydrate dehydratase n=1 Tax=Lentilactobacillus sp. Marseille-Q4993 TaxID=3039492 RepID=UPI0024BC4AED|nr:NAD(P)H-hydrate dehydratase [Lentilactobacillus sp. Marseille-Q4993]